MVAVLIKPMSSTNISKEFEDFLKHNSGVNNIDVNLWDYKFVRLKMNAWNMTKDLNRQQKP